MDCHPPQAASTQGKLLVVVVVVEQAVGRAKGQVEVAAAKSLLETAALALLLEPQLELQMAQPFRHG